MALTLHHGITRSHSYCPLPIVHMCRGQETATEIGAEEGHDKQQSWNRTTAEIHAYGR